MLSAIAAFELRQRVRAGSFWVLFGLFFFLGFLALIALAGAFGGGNVAVGKVPANAPLTLSLVIGGVSSYGVFLVAAVMGSAIQQDFQHEVFPLLYTTPLSRGAYLGGRYLGALATLALALASVGLGCLVGTWMPFVDRQLIGPNHVAAYVLPYLTLVLPNLAFMGALFLGIGALTRRMLPVWVVAVVLFGVYLIAGSLERKIEHRLLAALLDPFGVRALARLTEYWSPSERTTRLVGFEGPMLWNRALWLGVGALAFAVTFVRLRFAQGGERRGTKAVSHAIVDGGFGQGFPRVTPDARPALGALLANLTWLHARETVKSVAFLVIAATGVVFMIVASFVAGAIYGTPTWPVTFQVLELQGGTFSLFMLIITTIYAGELAWRERAARVDQILDAAPTPSWMPWAAKLGALVVLQVVMLAILMATGIGLQLARGYTHLELGLYVTDLFGLRLVDMTLVCVLALAVHALVNQKFVGHGVMILYYLATAFLSRLGVEHHQWVYGSTPGYTYSDMNGYGPFLGGVLWFDAYWAACAVMLAIASSLVWVRGLETRLGRRLVEARRRLGARPALGLALAALVFVGLGAWSFYNTDHLNRFEPRDRERAEAARYERTYRGKWLDAPQPRVRSLTVDVDLAPRDRHARLRGTIELENRTQSRIPSVMLSLPEEAPGMIVHRLAIAGQTKPTTDDKPLGLRIYDLPTPLAPGAHATIDFDLEYANRGFENEVSDTRLVENGTFLTQGYLPHVGYDPRAELSDDGERRKQHLGPRPRMRSLDDPAGRANSYVVRDADWIDFEATLHTDEDQIAIAPGQLVREWREGGRHHFHYKSERPILDFVSFLSARYQVMRDHWSGGGNDVAIEIYSHPGHDWNLARMMKAAQAALAYASANYSPYQHKTLRIVEFPRYEQFAQSFPNTIPYSEGIGFIARVDPTKEDDIDYPFYVTAHEVAHQWWAHQVLGADVQGATVLSETLAQYTSLMIMKHEYGDAQMRRFLKYELMQYLMGRALERDKELPLLRNENQQYIHYQKGSLIMYALQDLIGEDAVNRALKRLVAEHGYQGPPYPTSRDLLEVLRAETPEAMRPALSDWFEQITLYDLRAESASAAKTSDGKWEVTIQIAAKKLRADENGAETEVPLNDLVDVGVLDERGEPIALRKERLTQSHTTLKMVVDRAPVKAGVDPINKLVDRRPDDNVVAVAR